MTTICTGKKEGQQIKYIFLFFLLIPFFLIYFFICLTIPLIKFGKIKKNKGIVFFVRKESGIKRYLYLIFFLKMVADFTFAYLVVKHSSLVFVGHSRLYILRDFGHGFFYICQVSFGAQCSLGGLL